MHAIMQRLCYIRMQHFEPTWALLQMLLNAGQWFKTAKYLTAVLLSQDLRSSDSYARLART